MHLFTDTRREAFVDWHTIGNGCCELLRKWLKWLRTRRRNSREPAKPGMGLNFSENENAMMRDEVIITHKLSILTPNMLTYLVIFAEM